MNWTAIWLDLFGKTEWLGVNIGFWASMLICAAAVAGMNLLFWGMKPLGGRRAGDTYGEKEKAL
ncbi:hypothetical protein [Cloacibacillus sp.]|uniref:hypothetical protein n=1 Tax=Cloacibacillus sp. TaxID=2049023 RepID=UPI0025C1199E|nr:hypothetical protein [Cloacibacillus sp.]MCC8059016.1 hypothetical protein [Cloacibacillus sp.]